MLAAHVCMCACRRTAAADGSADAVRKVVERNVFNYLDHNITRVAKKLVEVADGGAGHAAAHDGAPMARAPLALGPAMCVRCVQCPSPSPSPPTRSQRNARLAVSAQLSGLPSRACTCLAAVRRSWGMEKAASLPVQ